MKRTLVLAICSVFVLAGVLVAQQPGDAASKEDVTKLFELMNSRQQAANILELEKKQIRDLLPTMVDKVMPKATPDEKQKMQDFLNGTFEKMFASMPVDEIIEASMPAYQHHFTHEDIQQLIQFYSTPVGQKVIHQMPAIMAEAMQDESPIMQKWINEQLTELQEKAEEFARTLREQKQKPEPPKPNHS